MDQFFNTIFSLGALQSVLIAIGINLKKPLQSFTKIMVTVLLFSIATVSLYYIVLIQNVAWLYPWIDSLGSAAWMALFPTIFLLAKSIYERAKWKRQYLWYYSIAFLFCIEAIYTHFIPNSHFYSLLNDNALFLDIWMVIFFVSSVIFTVKVVAIVVQSKKEIISKYAPLYFTLIALLLVGFVIGYVLVRDAYTLYFEFSLIATLQVLVFGMLLRLFKISSFSSLIGTPKYAHTAVSAGKMAEHSERLLLLMQSHKPYLDKKLTLAELAQKINLSPNQLSQLFQSELKTNFYGFINKYRLAHAEGLLQDLSSKKYTITAIAEMSGFNSKATFYKVFKEKHGVTPVVYLKEIALQ